MNAEQRREFAGTGVEPQVATAHRESQWDVIDRTPVGGLTVKTLSDLYNLALQSPARRPEQQEALEVAGVVLDRLEHKAGVHERIARTEPFPVRKPPHVGDRRPTPAFSAALHR